MLEMLKAYVFALWSDVVARMGALASVFFTLASVYLGIFNGIPGVAHAKRFWLVAAACSFMFANYRVWADEHRKRISQSPDFKTVLEEVDWEYQPEQNETALIVAVSFLNAGAPSVAQRWRGVLVVGGIKETLKSFRVTGGWFLPDVAGKNPLIILPQDQLTAKTAAGRVETGDMKLGRLFFSTPGNRVKFLESLNWTMEVTCDDFRGTPFTGIFKPHPRATLERNAFPDERRATQELWASIWGDNKHETRIPRGEGSNKEVRETSDRTLPIPEDRSKAGD